MTASLFANNCNTAPNLRRRSAKVSRCYASIGCTKGENQYYCQHHSAYHRTGLMDKVTHILLVGQIVKIDNSAYTKRMC